MKMWRSVFLAMDENRRNGITVDDSVWAKIQAL